MLWYALVLGRAMIRKIGGCVMLLYILQYLIGEAWHLFPVTGMWRPFIATDYGDTPAWIVKELSEEVNKAIIAAMLLIVGWQNKGLRVLFTAYLSYRVMDIAAWFYDHKQWSGYQWIYVLVTLIECAGWLWYFNGNYRNNINHSGSLYKSGCD